MSLEAGTRLGRYEIRSQLGAGGMGEVYQAFDTELDRVVAIKILREELAANQQRVQRFIQEAKAASALNHPHILTVFEIGQVGAQRFMATEFIQGETLREHIRSGSLSLNDILEMSIQAAGALAAAHEVGIVHRDIKPENIMVRRDGYIKLLDFGLAKLTEPTTITTDPEAPTQAMVNTDPGTVMGTAVYMSPEQAKGMNVDARTDLWSLGVLIYEMVTGQLPFPGNTSAEAISRILQKEPAPLTRYTRDAPAELERIVTKALTKNPEERYQTAKDLLIDLRNLKRRVDLDAELERSGTGEALGGSRSDGSLTGSKSSEPVSGIASVTAAASAGTTQPLSSVESVTSQVKQHKTVVAVFIILFVAGAISLVVYLRSRTNDVAIESVAVLPFVNQNQDPNSEYLSEGITEGLINSLSQLPHLKVMARTTVFRYKGRETDPQTVGKELGVQAVITGKLMQRGDTLVIQTDLVRVSDGSQIWGEQYSRKLADIIVVQSEIAREISDRLRLHLSGAERELLTKRATENTEAYELYLKGYHSLYKFTDDGIRKSIDYFQQATVKDPNYAPAYAGLAEAYLDAANLMSPEEASLKGKQAAQKASALDPSLGDAHYALALVSFQYEADWPTAEREFKQAIQLKPGNARAYDWYGFFLGMLGRFDEAYEQFKLGLDIDPLSLPLNADLATCYYWQRHYDQAIEQFRKTLDLDPNFPPAVLFLAQTYSAQGRYAEALQELDKIKSATGAFGTEGFYGYAYAKWGKRDEAMHTIDRLREQQKTSYVGPDTFASIYTGLGDKDKAFEAWSAVCHKITVLQAIKVDPIFDDLRSDPRYPDLVRCVGLTP